MKTLEKTFEEKLETLPANLQDQIRAWVMDGHKPGRFLQGILSNDLAAGVYRAGVEYRPHLLDIVTFFDWECPNDCWGSPEIVSAWTKGGGLNGRQALSVEKAA